MEFSRKNALLSWLAMLVTVGLSPTGRTQVSAVWSQRYGVPEQEWNLDTDGDGLSAIIESVFGTDPHQARSVVRLQPAAQNSGVGAIEWFGIRGIAYQLQRSTDAVQWTDLGALHIGVGGPIVVPVQLGGESLFRLRAVAPLDTDGDALNDYEEFLLHASPTTPDTDGDSRPDGEEFQTGRDPIRVDPVTTLQGVKSIASGEGYLMIRADGSLWAWGINSSGTVGDGTKTRRFTPVRVGLDSDWRQVAGTRHSVAIKADGSLWGWGLNGSGQLGQGVSTADRLTPLRIGTDNNWAMVSAGMVSTVALKTDGTLWDWGAVYLSTDSESPVRIGTSSDWLTVSAGGHHRVAVKQDGTLWAWGTNENGQLGIGSTTSSERSPTRVGLDNDWADAKASADNSVALKKDGTLWVWGNNAGGHLSAVSSEPKVYLPRQFGVFRDWTLGGTVTMALRSDGTLWSFNSAPTPVISDCRAVSGSLVLKKDGTLWMLSRIPQALLEEGAEQAQTTPRAISDERWRSLALAHAGTLAIRDDGTLWSWGDGSLGGGVGMFNARTRVGTAADWDIVVAGSNHAMALKTDRSLWTWGLNTYAQLGEPFPPQVRSQPMQVGTDLDWASIAAGGYRSFAIKTSGALWGWGDNGGGALGIGTTIPYQPTPISIGDALWAKLAPRTTSNAGLRTDGSLWTWGKNVGGTGSATPSNWTVPTPILPGQTWLHVAGGSDFWLAVRADGSLWGWGRNDIGQLGNGAPQTALVLTPIRIGTDADWAFVVSRQSHSLGIKVDGSLWAWGDNYSGQLGDGTTTRHTTPNRIGTGNDWATASLSSSHAAALKKDGSLWAWGDKYLIGLSLVGGPFQVGEDRNWGL